MKPGVLDVSINPVFPFQDNDLLVNWREPRTTTVFRGENHDIDKKQWDLGFFSLEEISKDAVSAFWDLEWLVQKMKPDEDRDIMAHSRWKKILEDFQNYCHGLEQDHLIRKWAHLCTGDLEPSENLFNLNCPLGLCFCDMKLLCVFPKGCIWCLFLMHSWFWLPE